MSIRALWLCLLLAIPLAAGAENVISGNTGSGVLIDGGTTML